MKKKIIFAICCVLLQNWASFGQNGNYINPPNYYNLQSTNTLPSPAYSGNPNNYDAPELGYGGSNMEGSSNAIYDKFGKPIFFVIDGYIFNRNGYSGLQTGNMNGPSDVRMPGVTGTNQPFGGGGTVIVPDPGNCDEFYIFSQYISSFGSDRFFTEMSIVKYNAVDHQIIDTYGLYNDFFPMPGAETYATFGLGGFANMGAVKHAVRDEYYFVLQLNDGLGIIRMDNTGIHRHYYNLQDENIHLVSNNNTVSNGRSQLEFANPIPNQDVTFVSSGQGAGSEFYVFKMNSDFNHLTNQSIVSFQPDISSGSQTFPSIHGIEISTNNRYAYLTKEATNNSNTTFVAIDLQNSNNVINVPLPTNINVSFSEIEKLKDANGNVELYFAHAGGLTRMNNSNNPSGVTHTNVHSFTNYASFSLNPPFQYNASKMYALPNQLDYFNYQSFANTTVFGHMNRYETSGNQVWSPGVSNNPFNEAGNILYVSKELVVKQGTVLTLNNLFVHFAKDAKLIIEEGGQLPAGKLVLNNTVLTVDQRCQTGDMWLGVEVRGNKVLPQGSVNLNSNANNSPQGHLVMKNNSVIEHAEIGVLLGSRTNGQFNYFPNSNSKTGGIVQGDQSSIINCRKAVYADRYATYNSLSYFKDCDFAWTPTNHFNNQAFFNYSLVQIQNVNNYSFYGCRFENSTTVVNQKELGIGINAYNSRFSVLAKAVGGVFPNVTYTNGTFKKLTKGIYVTCALSSRQSYKVDRQIFENCQFGIESIGPASNQITLNEFKTRELFQTNSAGIILRNNTGYKVEENTLTQKDTNAVAFADGRVYGIIVSNSGTADNQIYKNTFRDLYIGGQSERDNSPRVKDANGKWTSNTPNNNEGGLRWVCNNFDNTSNILLHDLIVVNGDVALTQENIDQLAVTTDNDRRKRAANNQFSLIGEAITLEHDIKVDLNSAHMQYMHLADPRMTPDSRTTAGQNYVQPILVNNQTGSPLSSNGTECPSKLNGVIKGNVVKGRQMLDSLRILNDVLSKIVDGGETAALVEQIKKAPVVGALVAGLLNKAPLSDTVLTEFIKRNPPASAVKTILLASSGLSEQVYAEYAKLNLPIGVKNEIEMAQNLVSERTRIERQYYHNQVKMQEIFNDILREQWFDSTVTQPYQQVLNTLVDYSDLFQNEELLALTANLYATVGNSTSELDQLVQQLMSSQISTSYKDLFMVDIATAGAASSAVLVLQQPENLTLVSTLANLNDLESESQLEASAILGARSYANAYLNLNKEGENPIILEPTVNRMMINQPMEEKQTDVRQFTLIYPNPSTGIVNVDFTEQMDGEMIIEVIDIQGKIVHNSTRQEANAEQLDLSHLNEGIYLIRVTIDEYIVGIERWVKK